jgi:hypothetical protein
MDVGISDGGSTNAIATCDSCRLHQVAGIFVLRFLGLLVETGNRSSASQAIESQLNDYAAQFSLTEKERFTAEYNRLARPAVVGTFSTATVLEGGMIAVKQDEIG